MEIQTVDVLLVTVNDAETMALREELEGAAGEGRLVHGERSSFWDYGPIGGVNVGMLRTSMGSGGVGGSAHSLGDAIRERRPSSVVAVGVCFGMDEDKQPIGQVIISERISAYELQRVGTDLLGEQVVVQRGTRTEASPRLVSRFRDGRLESLGLTVKTGELLSGEKLIDNIEFKSQLLSVYPDALGGEMEGAGVQTACDRAHVDWVVVKAVCDYAAEKARDKAARQETAARAAARAVVHVLSQGGLRP